jgi:hypothetical protein
MKMEKKLNDLYAQKYLPLGLFMAMVSIKFYVSNSFDWPSNHEQSWSYTSFAIIVLNFMVDFSFDPVMAQKLDLPLDVFYS